MGYRWVVIMVVVGRDPLPRYKSAKHLEGMDAISSVSLGPYF